MKYVIDIDKKYVNQVRSEKIDYMTVHMISLAINYATPFEPFIEGIKGEIEQASYKDFNGDRYITAKQACRIIDRHVKESEGNT